MRIWPKIIVVAAALLAAIAAGAQGAAEKAVFASPTAQEYKAAEFPAISRMPGFSGQSIANHLKLYQGYVNSMNALSGKLVAMFAEGRENTPEYAELKRRFGWEFNGMRLHELYFGNMGSKGALQPDLSVYKSILVNFGSFEAWRKDFAATGSMRGIGWAVLYEDGASGRLFNAWIGEHDGGHLAGGSPLLVMDVFEHAYMTDYQLDRAKYIDAFLAVIDWGEVNKRFEKRP
jgi:superoxide dismutase, Fe-Mn family